MPSEISQLSKLVELNLGKSIVVVRSAHDSRTEQGTNLFSFFFDAAGNDLEGNIPTEFGALTDLEKVSLGNECFRFKFCIVDSTTLLIVSPFSTFVSYDANTARFQPVVRNVTDRDRTDGQPANTSNK